MPKEIPKSKLFQGLKAFFKKKSKGNSSIISKDNKLEKNA